MNNRTKLILGIVFLSFISISAVSASENTTVDSLELNTLDTFENVASGVETTTDNEYEVTIVDTTKYDDYFHDESEHVMDYEDQLITCKVKDAYGYLDDAYVFMYDENGDVYEAWWDEDEHHYWFEDKLSVGEHEVTVYLDDDGYYTAEPLTFNVNIEKAYFTGSVTCKSYYGTTSGTLTMKATVKDSYDNREDGTVTFKVNGKSYTVKTKNGVATKKIKIKKAGTYTYTATFKSGNYYDKGVGKGKLYVYSTSKKSRTFKIKSYNIVVPLSKYKKLINVKNTNKLLFLILKQINILNKK